MHFPGKKKAPERPTPKEPSRVIDVFGGKELKRTFAFQYPTSFKLAHPGPLSWSEIIDLAYADIFVKERRAQPNWWPNGSTEQIPHPHVQFYIGCGEAEVPAGATLTGLNAFNSRYSDSYRGRVSGRIAVLEGDAKVHNVGSLVLTGRVGVYLALNSMQRTHRIYDQVTIDPWGRILLE